MWAGNFAKAENITSEIPELITAPTTSVIETTVRCLMNISFRAWKFRKALGELNSHLARSIFSLDSKTSRPFI